MEAENEEMLIEEVKGGVKRLRSSEDGEDSSENNKGKKSKEVRVYENTRDIDTQIEEAFANGTEEVKIGIRGTRAKELNVTKVDLGRVFKNVLNSEDELILTRNKNIIIKVKSVESAKKVSKITKINGEEIEKTFFDNTFTTAYVVKDVDPVYSVADIVGFLENQQIKVHKVIRFNKKGSDELTPTILIKELGVVKRKEVKINFTIYDVREFIEKPKICYRCLEFGHFLAGCKEKESKCSRCGKIHESIDCERGSQKCFRCGDPKHTAFDLKCPVVKEKSNLLKIEKKNKPKETKNVIKGNISYAEITKGNQERLSVAQARPDQASLHSRIDRLEKTVDNLCKIITEQVSRQTEKETEPDRNPKEIYEKLETRIIETIITKIEDPLNRITDSTQKLVQSIEKFLREGGQREKEYQKSIVKINEERRLDLQIISEEFKAFRKDLRTDIGNVMKDFNDKLELGLEAMLDRSIENRRN